MPANEGPWFIELTDSENEPTLINLSQITNIVAHIGGGSCVVFHNRDAIIVTETVAEITQRILSVVRNTDL